MEAAIAVLASFVVILVVLICLLCACSRFNCCCCDLLPESTASCAACGDSDAGGDGMDIIDSGPYGVDNIDVDIDDSDDDDSDNNSSKYDEEGGYDRRLDDIDRCEMFYGQEDEYFEDELAVQEVEYVPECQLCVSGALDAEEEAIITRESVV